MTDPIDVAAWKDSVMRHAELLRDAIRSNMTRDDWCRRCAAADDHVLIAVGIIVHDMGKQ